MQSIYFYSIHYNTCHYNACGIVSDNGTHASEEFTRCNHIKYTWNTPSRTIFKPKSRLAEWVYILFRGWSISVLLLFHMCTTYIADSQNLILEVRTPHQTIYYQYIIKWESLNQAAQKLRITILLLNYVITKLVIMLWLYRNCST